MDNSRARQPRRAAREEYRGHAARSRKVGREALTVHVQWSAGPRTRAWDDLWRWLLSDVDEANDEQPRDEVA